MIEDSKRSENTTVATERLRAYIKNQRFVPHPLHTSKKPYVRKDLDTVEYVFVRNDAVHPTLKPKFTGPYRILNRSTKYYTLDFNGKADNVSIDRLKPYK